MLRWIHPEKGRYYQADLVEDLFGGWSVITAWGSLHTHHGSLKTFWVPTREIAEKRLQQIARLRRQRGYEVRDAE